MVVVIVYSEQFKSNAKSLRDAVKNKWPDAGVNLMGTFGKSNDFSKYQKIKKYIMLQMKRMPLT